MSLLISASSSAVIIPDSIKARFDNVTLSPLEGVWHIPDGAVIAIKRGYSSGGDYTVTLLQSPDLRMPANTIIGNLKHSSNGNYTLTIATNVRNRKLCDRQTFDLKLRNDASLALTHKSAKPKIRISMILRFLGPTIGISKNANPGDIDLTAIRIYPPAPHSAFNPLAL